MDLYKIHIETTCNKATQMLLRTTGFEYTPTTNGDNNLYITCRQSSAKMKWLLGRKSSMIEEMSMARYTDSSIRSEGWSLPYPYDIHFAPLIIPKQTTVNTIILTINETFTILIIII
jgi:hypothetical protein